MYAFKKNITLTIYTLQHSPMKQFPPVKNQNKVFTAISTPHITNSRATHTHKLLSSKTLDVTAYQDNTNCSFGGYNNTYDNQSRLFYEQLKTKCISRKCFDVTCKKNKFEYINYAEANEN